MFEVQRAFAKHLDQWGLIGPGGEVTGNNILYTAYYMICLQIWHELMPLEMNRIKTVLQFYRIEDGLYMRTPSNEFGQQGPDDYVGLGVMAYLMREFWIAEDILEYGRRNLGSFNNINVGVWTWKSCLFRQRQLVCHLTYAAFRKPALLDRIIWGVTVLTSLFSKHQDSYFLSYCLVSDANFRG